MPNSFVFSPVENWTNDDVWVFLMQIDNPWGYRNKDLLTMYQGASEDGECPLVIDTTTPSCGDSRFGCWVCTLVEKDRSMMAMIQNDEEKEWMEPLLALRNELDPGTGPDSDRDKRDFRRMSGHVQIYQPRDKSKPGNVNADPRAIHGPYTEKSRGEWLAMLLEAQSEVRELGPPEVANIELITIPELQEIRRLWVYEKHEFEDHLPRIYQAAVGEPYPGEELEETHVFGLDELEVLKELCDENDLHYQLVRELLDIAGGYRTAARRAGLFDAIESALKRSGYESVEEATALAMKRAETVRWAGPSESPGELTFDAADALENMLTQLDDTRAAIDEASWQAPEGGTA